MSYLASCYAFGTANLIGSGPELPLCYRVWHPTMFDPAEVESAVAVTRATLFQLHGEMFLKLVATAESLPARLLLDAPEGVVREYAAGKLACIERAAWHEGWHAGEIAAIRRSHGLPPRF